MLPGFRPEEVDGISMYSPAREIDGITIWTRGPCEERGVT